MKISDNTIQTLQSINAFITLLNPLIGSALALGTAIVADVRSQGADVGPFADEIAKFDALVAGGIATDADWRRRHGLPDWPTAQPPAEPQPQPQPAEPPQPVAPNPDAPPDRPAFPDTGRS